MTSEKVAAKADAQFFFDLNKSPLFIKNPKNLINVAGQKQLNTLHNVSLLDIFLSRGNIIEPHYHQNATELIYCISGSVTVSILNPLSKQIMNFTLTPGQIVNIPQGWWHYIVTLQDHTHLLAIFDAPNPEVILGSDILKFTPASIIAQTYGVEENLWKQAVTPIQPSTFIGSRNSSRTFNHTFHPYQLSSGTHIFPPHPYPW